MTDIQIMILAFCFGAVIGYIVSGIIVMIQYFVKEHRKKKRIRKENEEQQ